MKSTLIFVFVLLNVINNDYNIISGKYKNIIIRKSTFKEVEYYFGLPDRIEIEQTLSTKRVHKKPKKRKQITYYYDALGISFTGHSYSSFKNFFQKENFKYVIARIVFKKPFNGATFNGIKIGSHFTEIEKAYPDIELHSFNKIDSLYLLMDSAFFFYVQNKVVYQINLGYNLCWKTFPPSHTP